MKYPVLITNQGETIAVAYDPAGIELAVQEHFVEPDIYLVGICFMAAEFSNGLMCDLEEITVYPYDELEEQQPSPEVTKLVEALEGIINPIQFIQERLREGERLDGMVAVQLANDAEYLKGIAKAALATYRKQGGNL